MFSVKEKNERNADAGAHFDRRIRTRSRRRRRERKLHGREKVVCVCCVRRLLERRGARPSCFG